MAVEEMVSRTSRKHATWHIVPANDKYYARIFVLKTIIRALEKRLYGEEIEKIDEEEDH